MASKPGDDLLGQDASVLGDEEDPLIGQDASALDSPADVDSLMAQAYKRQEKKPGILDTFAEEFTQGASKEWGDEAASKLYGAREYMRNLFGGKGLQESGTAAKAEEAPFLKHTREQRAVSRKENPGTAAIANLTGGLASDYVLNSATGGAFANPAGQALLGGVTGAGFSEGPLLSTETAGKTALGTLLGYGLGKAGQKYPAGTGGVMALLGLGGAAAGGIKGEDGQPLLSTEDRWQLGTTGVAAGSAALASKLMRPVANAAGKSLQGAKNEIEAPLRAKNVARAEGLASDNDKEIAEVEKGLVAAGKDKIRKFKKLVLQKQRGLKEDDESMTGALEAQAAKQEAADKASVEAFQASERGPAKTEASADKIAEFEASIPARVEGKENADYQAVLNRYLTNKQLGHEIPPEVEAQVQAIRSRYEKNSPGFWEKYLYNWKQNGEKYKQELMDELASMKGASSASEGPTTAVGTPKAINPDTGVTGRPPAMKPPPDLDQAQEAAANELKIPFEGPDPRFEKHPGKYPEALAFQQSAADENNLAMKQALGMAEAPGLKPDPARLLSDAEKDVVSKNLGTKARFVSPPRPPKDATLRNVDELRAYERGSNLPPEPGTNAGSPGRQGKAASGGEDYPKEFFEGAPPEPDFFDSPISNDAWKRLNQGAPLAEASSNTPRADMSLAENLPQTKAKLWNAAKMGAFTGGVPGAGTGAAVMGVKGAGAGASGGAIAGAMANVGRLASKDPASRAYLMDKVQRVFSIVPDFNDKYGRFLAAGSQGPAQDLVTRIQFLMAQDPEFAAAWEQKE